MVDRTYYTDGAELTIEEKGHLISFIVDVENYNINYETPAHYGPLVHVLNYGNIHGDAMVRFFSITTSCIANYEVITICFNICHGKIF